MVSEFKRQQDRLTADILATCNTIGYADEDKYFKDPECLASIKDLVLYLRRDDDEHTVRRLLGRAEVVQRDLIPLLKHYSSDIELFDVVLRLLVNLTNPALLVYQERIPKGKIELNQFHQITDHLQKYKQTFVDEFLWKKIYDRLKALVALEWENRLEDDKLCIERILLLLRNVLQVPADPNEEKRSDDDASIHDQIIFVLNRSGILELITSMSSNSDSAHEYSLHILEIISLVLREHNGEQLAKTKLERNPNDILREERELMELQAKENMIKEMRRKSLPTRHSRFGGTFEVRDLKAASGRNLLCHKPVTSVADLHLDTNKKSKRTPKNRLPMYEQDPTRRSTLSIRLTLRNFSEKILKTSYNFLMGLVKDRIVRSKTQDHDETYYLWAIKFFMEFNRFNKFRLQYVSETMSVGTFHYVQTVLDNYHDMMITDKDKDKIPLWSRRAHAALSAYQELLYTLLWMDKSGTEEEPSRIIKKSVFYLPEYRELCVKLLTNFDHAKFSKLYFYDLIETNHLFLKMLEEYASKPENRKILVEVKTKLPRKSKPKKDAKSKDKSKSQSSSKSKSKKKPEENEGEEEQEERAHVENASDGNDNNDDNDNYEDVESIRADNDPIVEGEISQQNDGGREKSLERDDGEKSPQKQDQDQKDKDQVEKMQEGSDDEEKTGEDVNEDKADLLQEIDDEEVEKSKPDDEEVEKPKSDDENDETKKDEGDVETNEEENEDKEKDQESDKDDANNENDENENDEEDDREIESSDDEDRRRREMESRFEKQEQDFNFKGFLEKYAHSKIMSHYGRAFRDWKTMKSLTFHCVMKQFHRYAFEMEYPSFLCQASVFKVFQEILSLPHRPEHIKEAEKFFYHLWPKFVKMCEANSKMFIELLFWKSGKDAVDIQDGYGTYTSRNAKQKKTNTRFEWTEVEENELEVLADEFLNFPVEERKKLKIVDWINSRITSGTKIKKKIRTKLVEKGYMDRLKQLNAKDKPKKPRKSRKRKNEEPLEHLETSGNLEHYQHKRRIIDSSDEESNRSNRSRSRSDNENSDSDSDVNRRAYNGNDSDSDNNKNSDDGSDSDGSVDSEYERRRKLMAALEAPLQNKSEEIINNNNSSSQDNEESSEKIEKEQPEAMNGDNDVEMSEEETSKDNNNDDDNNKNATVANGEEETLVVSSTVAASWEIREDEEGVEMDIEIESTTITTTTTTIPTIQETGADDLSE